MSMAVIAVVVTALVFDFTSGFHGTANAMTTSIATGALRPRVAVLPAGPLNLLGAFVSVPVALTISGGLLDETRITPEIVFAGLVGVTAAFAGTGAIRLAGLTGKVLVPLVLSPVVAGVAAPATTMLAYRLIGHLARHSDRDTVALGIPLLGARSLGTVSGAPCDRYDERAAR